MDAQATYTLTFDDAPAPEWTGSLADFLAGNAELDPAEAAAVAVLEPGESLLFGGGAAPLQTLLRVS